MDFKHYFTNAELEETLKQWSQDFPNLAGLTTIGKSYENRPIWLMTLTNRQTGADTDKPAIWLDGNIHATELAGTTTVLLILHHLLNQYGQNDQITRLLDTCTFYAVPRINPDGAEQAMAKNPRYLRSGVRFYPWEDAQPGLHERDMDGDGRILQMRIPDPNGDWKISAEEPRLMEKRAPDEQGGTYYRILPEGDLEYFDGDIIQIARPRQSLDFNRNFPFLWRTESEQPGAGTYPASESEIRAVTEFTATHLNINFALTFHTFARVLLRPYSVKPDDAFDTGDLWLYKKIGEIGAKLTGYPCQSTYHDFRFDPKETTTGAFDDWIFDQFGVISFTVELWDIGLEAGIKKPNLMDWYREHPLSDDITILNWLENTVGPGGYVDWYRFQHPQLGPVELGGWNELYTWRNPPHALLEAEAERHFPFVLSLAEMLPHLNVLRSTVRRAGENTWAVRLVAENSGYLPAYTTQQARQRKAVRPARAVLKLPAGARLISGSEITELGYLEGRSNKGALIIWDTSPTDNRAKAEWTVSAPEGTTLEVTLYSDRGGAVVHQIELMDDHNNH